MLDTALDYGCSEEDFWDMTMGEYSRFVQSKRRIQRLKMQERAVMDWQLADLVYRSIVRLYSSSAKMPECSDYYSALFDEQQKKVVEERKKEQKNELSVLRFKQFAESYNKRFKEVQKDWTQKS